MTYFVPILHMRTLLSVQSVQLIFSVLNSCQGTLELKEDYNTILPYFSGYGSTVWAGKGTHRQKIYKATILKNYNPLHTYVVSLLWYNCYLLLTLSASSGIFSEIFFILLDYYCTHNLESRVLTDH